MVWLQGAVASFRAIFTWTGGAQLRHLFFTLQSDDYRFDSYFCSPPLRGV